MVLSGTTVSNTSKLAASKNATTSSYIKSPTSSSNSNSDMEEKETKNSTAGDGRDKNYLENTPSAAREKNEKEGVPTPLLKGTLSYNLVSRRHIMRGNWRFEENEEPRLQRFELVRNLGQSEDPKVLPKDGEFHGSFSMIYSVKNSKGKQKEKSQVISESGVNITFVKKLDEKNAYNVKGRGTNQFGVFDIIGTAHKSNHEGDESYDIILRKKYPPSAQPGETKKSKKKGQKRKHNNEAENQSQVIEEDSGQISLPPPSTSHPEHVVCLRGKLTRSPDDMGNPNIIQQIKGMWSSGLDLLEEDPDNKNGLCNPFEYEHRSTVSNESFPLSGRYTGWFLLSNDDDTRTRVQEKDVTLKFRKNSEGYWNIEGRGSNGFGKYNITGTLQKDFILTIFRHFQVKKTKLKPAPNPKTNPNPPVKNGEKKSSSVSLTLDDVVIPNEEYGEVIELEPLTPPARGEYTALMRGILRINTDGAHTCSGKWAQTRDHFTNSQTSNFHFGVDAHNANISAKIMRGHKMDADSNSDSDEDKIKSSSSIDALGSGVPSLGQTTFPVDSVHYKGTFKMRRGGTKYANVVDQQIVLKFRKNTEGSCNVYGKGENKYGIFNLVGTLVQSSKGSGHLELYRSYAPTESPNSPSKEIRNGSIVASKHFSGSSLLSKKLPLSGSVEAKPGHIPKLPKPKIALSALDDDDLSEGEVESPEHDRKDSFQAGEGSNPPTPTSCVSSIYLQQSLPTPCTSILPSKVQSAQPSQRSSSRQSKLPSHLSEDDPKALNARIMEKCAQLLRTVREKDLASGSFFAEPVDPVALGIPNYHKVISNPMDLGTIQKMLNSEELNSYQEFGRLGRLVFENAIAYNVDTTHAVHIAAKALMNFFCQKFKEVEKDGTRLTEIKKPKRSSKADKEQKRKDKEAAKDARRKQREVRELRKKQAKAERDARDKDDGEDGQRRAKKARVEESGLHGGYVTKKEFDALKEQMNQMRYVIELFQKQLIDNGLKVDLPLHAITPVIVHEPESELVALAQPVECSSSHISRKSVENTKESANVEEEKKLTLKEQEILTETINRISSDKLPGVIQIIRESTKLSGDEEEIDLEIDQLDTATQRKLQRFVMKNVKSRRSKPKAPAKRVKVAPPPPSPKSSPKASPVTKKPRSSNSHMSKKLAKNNPKSKAKPVRDSFLHFNSDSGSDDSSTSSDDDDNKKTDYKFKESTAQAKKEDSFNLGDENSDAEASVLDDDDDKTFATGNMSSWNLSNLAVANENDDESDSDNEKDLWTSARKEAAASNVRESDRKNREERQRIEAERVKQQRLEEAAAHGARKREQMRAKEQEEEKERQKLHEKREEERRAARELIRKETASVKQDVNMEEQRDVMRQIEQGLMDVDDGASPSSDFGF